MRTISEGAQKVGMKTIYIDRWTDDIEQSCQAKMTEFDVYLKGMEELPDAVKNLSL